MEMKTIKVPFEVEMAKRIQNGEVEGKVVTRDGQSVRIVCFEAKQDDPVVALISYDNAERVKSYAKDGIIFEGGTHPNDLMLEVPEYMTFKDGDIVAFGNNNDSVGLFKSLNLKEKTFSSYATLAGKNLVFYEPSWKLINIRIATEEQRQRIVYSLKSSEVPKAKECLKKLGIEEKPKCEFKPFDKVLVRDLEFGIWYADIFSHINKDDGSYMCIGSSWDECIPYNEQTAHLLGTTENYK